MAKNNKYSVPYRRKREGKTDYRKRLKLLLGSKPRLVVRKSGRHISLQIIEFSPVGDRVVASAHSKELQKLGWKASTNNVSAAYLTGLLLAKKVKKVPVCILDIGNNVSVKGSVLYAAVKGCIDGKLNVPCAKAVLPSEDRISGKHVAEFAKALKSDKDKYNLQFSNYVKSGFDPEKLPGHVDEIKGKITQ